MARELRRHKRFDVDDVRGTLVHNLDARVLNMSLTGMAIETSTKLAVGGSYRLRIPHRRDDVRFEARVKWCRLIRTEKSEAGDVVPVYQAGIDFRHILDEKARQILDFIESNIIVELDRRIFGRFKIDDPERLDLEENRQFTVRRLSLSGMLIVTDFRPEENEVFDLEINRDGSSFECRGRVAYLGPELADGPHEIGIEFLALSDEAAEALEAIVESLIE